MVLELKNIERFLFENGMIKVTDILIHELWVLCKIFINGKIVGCHKDPMHIENIFKLYRRNGLINSYVSLSFNKLSNEILINTDNGRLIGPLYIAKNNNVLLQPKHITMINEDKIKYSDLTIGFHKKRNYELNQYSDKIYSIEDLGIDKNTAPQSIINTLTDNCAVIEYLDTQELSNTLPASKFDNMYDSKHNYTHVELHPSLILGVCGSLIPYVNNAPSPRGIYSSKQIKQGAGMYGN